MLRKNEKKNSNFDRLVLRNYVSVLYHGGTLFLDFKVRRALEQARIAQETWKFQEIKIWLLRIQRDQKIKNLSTMVWLIG